MNVQHLAEEIFGRKLGGFFYITQKHTLPHWRTPENETHYGVFNIETSIRV